MFSSYGDCCNYRWINTEECMKHANECLATVAPAPSISSLDLWYPDINSNRCKNDGNNPDGVLTWTSYQVCCTRTMPGNSECEANSQASVIQKFYPKYFDSVCANDGKQPPNEVRPLFYPVVLTMNKYLHPPCVCIVGYPPCRCLGFH